MSSSIEHTIVPLLQERAERKRGHHTDVLAYYKLPEAQKKGKSTLIFTHDKIEVFKVNSFVTLLTRSFQIIMLPLCATLMHNIPFSHHTLKHYPHRASSKIYAAPKKTASYEHWRFDV
jgi:hypothetical protein